MTAPISNHITDQEARFRSLRGHALTIRRLRAADGEDLARFLRHGSPRSRRFRFFTTQKAVEPARLEQFLDLDFHDHAAFVATLDGISGIQAVGWYERASPGCAAVAFTVADDLQGEGIGTELLHRLASLARTQGITTFTAFGLSENQRMFEMFRNCGYPMSAECDAGVSVVTVELGGKTAGRVAECCSDIAEESVSGCSDQACEMTSSGQHTSALSI